MDAQEFKCKMQSIHLMDQEWAKAKSLIKSLEDPHTLSLLIAETIKNSNLPDSDKTISIYFLGMFFKKITFEINCDLDDEDGN